MLDPIETRRIAVLERECADDDNNKNLAFHTCDEFDDHGFNNNSVRDKPGMARLKVFLKVLALTSKTNRTSGWFGPGEYLLRILTLAHLRYIVGDEYYDDEFIELARLINAVDNRPANVLWNAARQVGKTTIMTRMLTALIMVGIDHGASVYLYCTTIETACGLLTRSKLILHSSKLKTSKYYPTILYENESKLVVRTIYGNTAIYRARPGLPRTCRGDEPSIVWVDEAQSINNSLYREHIIAMMQNPKRVVMMVGTPPKYDSYLNDVIDGIKRGLDYGVKTMRYIDYGRVCEHCQELDIPEECVHMLWLVPDWVSVRRLEDARTMNENISDEAYLMETIGHQGKYKGALLPRSLLKFSFEAEPFKEFTRIRNDSPWYISIDPPQHGSSQCGITAFIRADVGIIYIGLSCIVSITEADILKLQNFIIGFMEAVRKLPFIKQRRCVPLIETNGADYVSKALYNGVCQVGPIENKFLYNNKIQDVKTGFGVLTTEANKAEMFSDVMLQYLMNNQILFIENLVTHGSAKRGSNVDMSPSDIKKLYFKQLSCVRRQENGKISGKVGKDGRDDLAMAGGIGLYHERKLAPFVNGIMRQALPTKRRKIDTF